MLSLCIGGEAPGRSDLLLSMYTVNMTSGTLAGPRSVNLGTILEAGAC